MRDHSKPHFAALRMREGFPFTLACRVGVVGVSELLVTVLWVLQSHKPAVKKVPICFGQWSTPQLNGHLTAITKF